MRSYGYYGVSAVYTGSETDITSSSFGIAYLQPDSLSISDTPTNIPVVDGAISDGEYEDAKKVVLTNDGYWADAYIKTANNKLYIAFDCFGDDNIIADDYVLFAFDANNNLAYEDSVEGYYRMRKTGDGVELAYFPYTALGFLQGELNPIGFSGLFGYNQGRVQAEISLDLTTSMLNVEPYGKIGAFISAFDIDKMRESSWKENLLAKEYSVAGFGTINFNSFTDLNTEEQNEIPSSYVLNQNYPNPFNPRTIISFSIPQSSFVNLTIYDITGREIKTLINDYMSSGNYSVNFDTQSVTGGFSSGVYFYRLVAGNFMETKQMILLK